MLDHKDEVFSISIRGEETTETERKKRVATMEAKISASPSLFLPPSFPNPSESLSISDFHSQFIFLNTILLSSDPTISSTTTRNNPNPRRRICGTNHSHRGKTTPNFLSTSISIETPTTTTTTITSHSHLNTVTPTAPQTLTSSLSVFERSLIGAFAGGLAGAFTNLCLHPLDTIKTKLQTKGASQIYTSAIDAVAKTFQSSGVLGFYSGISAVIVGSAFSSSVYFGTCEFGKSVLSRIECYPRMLIPPTAGAMGNIVSSAIMVPKELITQRMQAGAKGRSWEVLVRILERDGVLGLYAGYSATLLRNLPAGVLSYSSFEYLKAAVLSKKEKEGRKKKNLEPIESVVCGALAGAISASLTTPLDVVKTRLMTQVRGDGANKVAMVMYDGVRDTVKRILMEEGWVGFTRGMGPRVLYSACFSALGYCAFETAKISILHRYLEGKESQKNEMPESPT